MRNPDPLGGSGERKDGCRWKGRRKGLPTERTAVDGKDGCRRKRLRGGERAGDVAGKNRGSRTAALGGGSCRRKRLLLVVLLVLKLRGGESASDVAGRNRGRCRRKDGCRWKRLLLLVLQQTMRNPAPSGDSSSKRLTHLLRGGESTGNIAGMRGGLLLLLVLLLLQLTLRNPAPPGSSSRNRKDGS